MMEMPSLLLEQAVEDEISCRGSGVDRLLDWWNSMNPGRPAAGAFEILQPVADGRMRHILTLGNQVSERERALAGDGAASCGCLVFVFTRALDDGVCQSWTMTLDGARWFDASVPSSAWRGWSADALGHHLVLEEIYGCQAML